MCRPIHVRRHMDMCRHILHGIPKMYEFVKNKLKKEKNKKEGEITQKRNVRLNGSPLALDP